MKKALFLILIVLVGLTQYTDANLQDTIENKEYYLHLSQDIVANKLYPINDGASVYFFGSYKFFTAQSLNDINQLKRQLNRDKLLILFDKEKTLMIGQYNDTKKICTPINQTVSKLFDAYPEKIKTQNNKIFLIGTDTNEISCYQYNNILYLPNDIISKKDLKYIYNNTNRIQTIINQLKKTTLKNIYRYITRNTSYNYTALEIDDRSYDPYTTEGFFKGQKVVCDGYSKTFAFLANTNNTLNNAIRITGSRQEIDSDITSKAFSHSWVKIGNLYYDPTFDDSNDNKQQENYFGKSQTCFNLDHYAKGREMFTTPQERLVYSQKHSQELLTECPYQLSQILVKDKNTYTFIQYLINTTPVNDTKKFLCDAYKICYLSAESPIELINQLKRYSIQLGNQNIPLKGFTYIQNISKEIQPTKSSNINPQMKIILDNILKNIKIKILFYSKEKIQQYIYNIKINVLSILRNPSVPDNIKQAMRYLSIQLSNI